MLVKDQLGIGLSNITNLEAEDTPFISSRCGELAVIKGPEAELLRWINSWLLLVSTC
jgi:hypothetical protein